jgi:hypothetical protein
MRGSPLLSALAAFFAIALMGWPISRLTWAKPAPPVEPGVVVGAGEVVKARVEIEFTRAPEAVRIVHLGRTLFSRAAPGDRVDGEIELAWPEEGVDLVFEVDWPEDDALSGARVTLAGRDGEERQRGIWARGKAAEVLTF